MRISVFEPQPAHGLAERTGHPRFLPHNGEPVGLAFPAHRRESFQETAQILARLQRPHIQDVIPRQAVFGPHTLDRLRVDRVAEARMNGRRNDVDPVFGISVEFRQFLPHGPRQHEDPPGASERCGNERLQPVAGDRRQRFGMPFPHEIVDADDGRARTGRRHDVLGMKQAEASPPQEERQVQRHPNP